MVGSVNLDNIQNESHDSIKKEGNEKYVCWVIASRDRYPPRVKNPVFLVRHMYPAMKVHESVERPMKPVVRPRKFVTHKNTQDLVKTSEYQSLSNGF